jgi:nucleoside-diphosphate-sugar epimerase
MTLFRRTIFRKPRLLIIGCGDVGMRMLPILVKTHRVFVLTSQKEKMAYFRSQGVVPIYGNLDQPSTLSRLIHLAPSVIHLAPPNNFGAVDLRTKTLLQVLGQGQQARHLIYISTTGVYGDCQGDLVTEIRTPNPKSARGHRRLSAEQQLRAWAISHKGRVTILRVPGIYAADRLPIERLKNGSPALNPSEDVFTNHIHADDLARIIILTLYRGVSQRIIHACDASRLQMGEYFDLVANHFGLPLPPRVAFAELKERVSPAMISFMEESRRINNDRLMEIGCQLRYPTVGDFLKTLDPNFPSV